jgi:L-asparaginase II
VEVDHPVQRRMRREIARWTETEPDRIGSGVDGCGVVCFRVPLEAVAASFARFAEAARRGERGPAGIVAAMTDHPWMVAGTGRLCTALMEVTDGRVFAKVGAEGVYGLGVPDRGVGIAVKVEDGAKRAAEIALLRLLDAMSLLDDAAREALSPWLTPPVRNTRGEIVGHLEADVELGPALPDWRTT